MKGLLRIAFLTVAVLLVQGTWALAGVTGSLNGTVLNESTHAPVAQAHVTVSSASQTSSTTTDNGGHFGFVSLVPDTYSVTVTKEGVIETLVQRGVTVLADQVQSLTLVAKPQIKTLATVTSRATTDLVKPGTIANVYSINAAAQARTATLGGGGAANQGYSAIASMPGAYVAPGQAGWFQVVNIRGGDYDQVGYEFDGVPVNRSFDNYPSSNLSAIGQQELQIYTGATPATAEGQGLAGYLNQVIKSGTYPGYGTVDLGIGGPGLYNKASLEFGGASPNRNFSYYVGLGVVNSKPQWYDTNMGVSQNATYGLVFDMQAPGGHAANCATSPEAIAENFTLCYHNAANSILGVPAGPAGYYLGSADILQPKSLEDRENVFNVHFGIPHKGDTGKDDIQLLYDSFQLYTNFYNAPNDWGGGPQYYPANTLGALEGPGQPIYFAGFQWNNPLGSVFPGAAPGQAGNVVNYAYPNTGGTGFFGEPIPGNNFEGYSNGQEIYKLQYQHNIGTQSYLRLYGYGFYSWWFIQDPQGAYNLDYGLAPDYELWTHTRGASLNYVNQLSPKNLLNFEGTYSTASTVRDNNTQMFNFTTDRSVAAQLVSISNPLSGLCYSGNNPGLALSCLKATVPNSIVPQNSPNNFGPNCPGGTIVTPTQCSGDVLTFGQVQGGGVPAIPAGAVCPGGCEWMQTETGPYATFNTVTPAFWGISIQDTWKPNDRLSINLGLRDNIYQFGYTPTGGGTRPYWFNAWNAVACVNPLFNGGNPVDETTLGSQAGTACSAVSAPGFPAGSFAPATLTDTTANGGNITYTSFEPRVGGTYTMSANDVIRFSAGRYSQPANAAFQQYNSLDQDLPEHLLGPLFYKYGFSGPNHTVTPSISYNYDISLEHQFPNTQMSFVLTPFLRLTNNQVQQLYIAPTQAFVSGLNVGNESNSGFEFLFANGNFNNNGWAEQLSYTYTYSYIKY
ncbi:MAG: TonB-dependent receptor, partial [Candidatus Eremiobacteraeota bacterium]|nr:TonB-dependent receptor [Candidatus Eremiobacteraeota bacterium]